MLKYGVVGVTKPTVYKGFFQTREKPAAKFNSVSVNSFKHITAEGTLWKVVGTLGPLSCLTFLVATQSSRLKLR